MDDIVVYVQLSIEHDKGCLAPPPLVFFVLAVIGKRCPDNMMIKTRGRGGGGKGGERGR